MSQEVKLQGVPSVHAKARVSTSLSAPRNVLPGPGVSEDRNILVASSGTDARSPMLVTISPLLGASA